MDEILDLLDTNLDKFVAAREAKHRAEQDAKEIAMLTKLNQMITIHGTSDGIICEISLRSRVREGPKVILVDDLKLIEHRITYMTTKGLVFTKKLYNPCACRDSRCECVTVTIGYSISYKQCGL